MIEIILILAILGVTVFVHELGHFVAAKSMGIAVEKFSIGWGPKIVSFKRGETEYQLSWLLLLGGFVKLAGENPAEVEALGDKAFLNKPAHKKIIVASSGVVMNFIFAIILMWFVFLGGTDSLKPELGDVKAGYPAYEAGIQKGDIITNINGKDIKYWNELTEIIKKNGLDTLNITILRNGIENKYSVMPRMEETEDVLKDMVNRPFIGISPLGYLPVIESVDKDYPAEKAGLKPGDEILIVNNKKIKFWDEVTKEIKSSEGKDVTFLVKRGERVEQITVTPKMEKIKDGEIEKKIPIVGIMPTGNYIKERYGVFKAAEKAVTNTLYFTEITFKAIYKMLARKIEPDVAGPIGVAHITYKVAKTGFINLLLLFAIININLAIFNFLPLLPLDGGLVLIFVIESIIRRPLPAAVQDAMMQLGWFLIIFMLIFFTYKDILRLFGH